VSATQYSPVRLSRRLLNQARPYRLHIAAIFLVSALATPLALLTPLPLKIAIDNVIGSQPIPGFIALLLPETLLNHHRLALTAALVVAIGLLIYLQSLALWLLQTYTGEKLVLGLRSQLFRHVQRLSLAYHDSRGTHDALYRIQYDAQAIESILVNGVTPLITSALTVAAMIIVTARIDGQLAAVALLVCPVLFFLARSSRQSLRWRWREVKEVQSSALSVVHEVLAALRVVKAFGQEEREQDRFIHHARKGLRGQVELALIEGSFDVLVGLTIAAGTAATLYIGVHHVRAGILTLGDLILVTAYISQLFGPLENLTKRIAQLQSALASAERAFELFDEIPDVAERAGAQDLANAAGAVEFRDVCFAYDQDHLVLRSISFALKAGDRVGVVGTTGSGKTTLINLLTRFYDPSQGQILLNGIDLRDYKLTQLRNQFAIVLQEPVLFSTSIAENIAYARPETSEAEIIDAAKAANAHDFIAALPDGYDTLVGERGMRLSGGERQRISLARAFLKNAPILILDEPTSSVDIRTEDAILEAMERLMIGRTAFTITHRPSALKYCNVILRIENGCLLPAAPGEASNQDVALTSNKLFTPVGVAGIKV
jgi:ATP-binding cassette subfamily B protein